MTIRLVSGPPMFEHMTPPEMMAEIKRLRTTLKPFAALRPDHGNAAWMTDRCTFGLQVTSAGIYSSTITLADIKAARAALGGDEQRGDK